MLRRVVDAVLRGRGALPRTAGALCFEEDTSLNGGLYVWKTILKESGRCLASHALDVDQTVVIGLDSAPETVTEIMESEAYRLVVLDGYYDPEGWLTDANAAAACPNTRKLKLAAESLEAALHATLTAKSALVVDSLTSLLFRFGLPYVMQFLIRIRRNPLCCCIVARYHTEGRDKAEVEAIRSMFSGRLQLSAPNAVLLPLVETAPHGAVTSFQTSETGRILSQTEWYQVNGIGDVTFFAPPDASAVDTAKLVEARVIQTIPNAHSGKEQHSLEETLMQQMEGGMKLTLTKRVCAPSRLLATALRFYPRRKMPRAKLFCRMRKLPRSPDWEKFITSEILKRNTILTKIQMTI